MSNTNARPIATNGLPWDEVVSDAVQALRSQKDEVTRALDFLVAQRLTLRLVSNAGAESCSDLEISEEEEILQMELAHLLEVEQRHVVAQAAAVAIEDERIALHDHTFALALSRVDAREWELFGDCMEDPVTTLRIPLEMPQQTIRRAKTRPNASSGSSAVGPARPQGVDASQACQSGIALASPTAPSAAALPSLSTQKCLICYEDFSQDEMISALRGDAEPSSSTSEPGCGHYGCRECMQQFARSQVHGNKYPLICPSPGCRLKLQLGDVHDLLGDSVEDLKILRRLEVEHAVGAENRIYCPYKDCSVMLIKDEEAAKGPTLCPECDRRFCPDCLITGSHEGFSCEAFQALPAHLRSAEDAAVLKLSADRRWKKCPSCRMLVERSEGCNHVLCLCQTAFCYQCGRKYTSNAQTANNQHGTPSCKCDLFDVPEEAQNARERRGQRRPMHPPAERPSRHGRKVSKKPCWHSNTLAGCPRADVCWFWHEEDGRDWL